MARGMSDFRRLLRMQRESDARLEELEKRKQAVDLGTVTITVGSLLAITIAGAKRQVVPFAG